MTSEHQPERRSSSAADILAVSRDEAWLHFIRKTLRRHDKVEILKDLSELSDHLSDMSEETLVLISSELVPSKIKDLRENLDGCKASSICVLKVPKDEHQRVNDKHLKGLGLEVADRPDNSKALRRLIKILVH